ncbi:MAG: hypothetical protein AW09_000784 [Candidatus Accumulibacter phosphatis]|uniref:Uncharacterized protein n=1 Tax=Candidatus Accumulibacter phosphatis TaxID=327160 RepID=A0A080M9Y7_9PROT|nr:MAG: hypothetical protein AW09_000784 [Candidatus Accumulibacter phosphatis]
MRGNQRQFKIGRQIGGDGDQRLLLRLAIALHFEVEGRREQLLPAARALRSLFVVALQKGFADVAGSGTRESDQPIDTDFLQHPARDFSPPTHPRRQVGARQQLAELQIALPRATEQQQTIGAVGVAVVGNPDIAAEQRLDPLTARRGIELDQTEEVREVRQRQCRHAVAGSTGNRIGKTDDAVGDRILAVQAEVDERGFRHPAILPRGETTNAMIAMLPAVVALSHC